MVPVSGTQNLVQLGIYGVIGLVAVIGAVVLAYHGAISGDAAAAVLTGALTLAGGAAASQGAIHSSVNGKSVVSNELLAETGATNRTAIVAAAGSQPQAVTPVEPMTHAESEG